MLPQAPAPRRTLPRPGRLVLLAILVAATTVAAGCSSGPSGTTGGAVVGPPCPTDPLTVVVSVDQWGDIVQRLGGRCATVTTVVSGASVDPHDFEPTAADAVTFTGADLVVVNGVGYDRWADKAVAALSSKPPVVDCGKVVGATGGANPHLWYDPAAVERVAAAVTAELSRLSPTASTYFAARATDWTAAMAPYRAEIAKVKALAAGKTYAATESVFDDLARAVGLRDVTPAGYHAAAANESDPSPGDLNDFQQALRDGKVDVLVYNTQTEGAIPQQIRSVAEAASVPVVDVTETVAPGATSFVDWQVSQLQDLERALR